VTTDGRYSTIGLLQGGATTMNVHPTGSTGPRGPAKKAAKKFAGKKAPPATKTASKKAASKKAPAKKSPK
jgi:hypothetical protein